VTATVMSAYVNFLHLRHAIRTLWYLRQELGPGGQRPCAMHFSLQLYSYS